MGMVFGKIDVAEPAYDVVVNSGPSSRMSWEVRRYGERFAIEAEYPTSKGSNDSEKNDDDDRTPFMELAGYIGVMGPAQNEGSTKIAMTAPVAIENDREEKEGTKIAMTAPVAIESTNDADGQSSRKKKMQFFLPAEFDDMSKIPKPTNPGVKVVEVPPAVGAVHKYNGSFNMDRSKELAKELVNQLREDGMTISADEEKTMINNFQSWGYNPPFTVPYFRRNEIWVPLTDEKVDEMLNFSPSQSKAVN